MTVCPVGSIHWKTHQQQNEMLMALFSSKFYCLAYSFSPYFTYTHSEEAIFCRCKHTNTAQCFDYPLHESDENSAAVMLVCILCTAFLQPINEEEEVVSLPTMCIKRTAFYSLSYCNIVIFSLLICPRHYNVSCVEHN